MRENKRTDGRLVAPRSHEHRPVREEVERVRLGRQEPLLADVAVRTFHRVFLLLLLLLLVLLVLVLVVNDRDHPRAPNLDFPAPRDVLDRFELADRELLQRRRVEGVDGGEARGDEGLEEAKRVGGELVAKGDHARDADNFRGVVDVLVAG